MFCCGMRGQGRSINFILYIIFSPDKEEMNRIHSRSATQKKSREDPVVIPRPPTEPRVTNKVLRPWSSGKKDKQESFNIGAKLANLDKIKNTPSSKQFEWSAEITTINAWQSNSEDLSEFNSNSFICPDCDKMYISNRDLEIHHNFCYGRLK